MIEDLPTVFVIPPSASLECSLHKGILIDPVNTPCGCTYCRSCILDYISEHHMCPTHNVALFEDHLRHNEFAQGFINELLIHCRGGLQKTSEGTWILNPEGCKLWINLGTRKEHEDNCVHVRRLKTTNTSEIRQPDLHTCIYREAGCLFIGSTLQDIMVHTELCNYGHLLRRVEQLELNIVEKDKEIDRLQKEVETRTTGQNVHNLLDSISRGIDKLDEESTRLFEDAKDTLRKTRTNIFNSSAYQTSLQVLHSIKEAVESARNEFVAKVMEFEQVAKNKVRAIKNEPSHTEAPIPAQPEPIEVPSLPAAPPPEHSASNSNDEPPFSPIPVPSNVDTQSQNTQSMPISGNTDPAPVATPPGSPETTSDSEDEDLKEFLLVSKQEYLQEQEARKAEEEAVRQAVMLSLQDQNKQ
eukprot:Phypoly_transcript_07985.p1 GENE.Phypoly_transcript_07985~~Phypoly_transcript_07985.p1  ORF type:complete len:413 (+),score=55.84 Phypoly_transcript_07985:85-1323(+)